MTGTTSTPYKTVGDGDGDDGDGENQAPSSPEDLNLFISDLLEQMVRNLKYHAYNIQYTIYNIQYTIYNIQT